MQNLKKLLYIIISLYFVVFKVQSQSFNIYDEKIKLKDHNYNLSQNQNNNNYYNYCKTVKIENNINELLDPIIKLKSSEILRVSFDILSNESHNYAYTFIHCDSEWNYSDIPQSEYLNGFYDNYITNYTYSFNTLSSYCHYEFSFPNENVNFTKSGNYIVLIYDDANQIPIATKRFIIHEDILSVQVDVKQTSLARDRETKQEVDFYITNHNAIGITNPHNELKIIIQKNDDWNDIINNCKPSFIGKDILEYDYQDEISFLAGNEYRDFDIKSLRHYGKNIQSIEQQIIQDQKIYYVQLQQDLISKSKEYEFKYDLNGKYVTSVSENKNKNNEAEYALVQFKLKTNKIDKDIFIYGELTNWDVLHEAKMNYNDTNQEYYGFLFLKQGYYNYQFIQQDNNKSISYLDLDYKETRNQYSVYVYFSPIWSNYDRLIGIGKSTSNGLN